jgi:hypothetical protein
MPHLTSINEMEPTNKTDLFYIECYLRFGCWRGTLVSNVPRNNDDSHAWERRYKKLHKLYSIDRPVDSLDIKRDYEISACNGSDSEKDQKRLASEFFAFVQHTAEVQEPSVYHDEMNEEKLRSLVNNKSAEYGDFCADFVFHGNSFEEFVYLDEIYDEEFNDANEFDAEEEVSFGSLLNRRLRMSVEGDGLQHRIPDILIVPLHRSFIPQRQDVQNAIEEIKTNKHKSFSEFTDGDPQDCFEAAFAVDIDIPLESRYENNFFNSDQIFL